MIQTLYMRDPVPSLRWGLFRPHKVSVFLRSTQGTHHWQMYVNTILSLWAVFTQNQNKREIKHNQGDKKKYLQLAVYVIDGKVDELVTQIFISDWDEENISCGRSCSDFNCYENMLKLWYSCVVKAFTKCNMTLKQNVMKNISIQSRGHYHISFLNTAYSCLSPTLPPA